MSHLANFQEWLIEHEGLSSTTARKAMSDVRTQMEHGSTPPESEQLRLRLKDYRYAWALWADFCEAEELENELPEPPKPEAPPPSHRQRRRRREPRRLKEAVSVPLEEWRAFVAVVAKDETPAGRVVDVLCATGMRISDVLRTPREALATGFAREDGITRIVVKGSKPIVYSVLGAEEQWRSLHKRMKPKQIVAQLVSKDSGWTANEAAYQRCRRKLHELAALAGIEGRIHLHRLRRTVAVQIATTTGNPHLVQKLLSHEDYGTTQGYLDESQALEVAKVLREHNRKMRGEE